MNLPNLFFIGVPRSGSTSLVYELKNHPNIFVPYLKEPRFFDREIFYDFEEDYIFSSLSDYLKIYEAQNNNHLYRLDASLFAIYSEKTLIDILKVNEKAKFLVVLRNPLDAAKSMHRMRLSNTHKPLAEISEDFYECWDMINERKKGFKYPKNCRHKLLFRYDLLYSYNRYLPFVKKNINPKNIIYINYNTYKNEPKKVHKYIFDFLNIPHVDLKLLNMNKSIISKKNFINRFIDTIVFRSSNFRKKLNLTGNKVDYFKKIYYFLRVKNKVKNFQNSAKDKEIKMFFSEAYKSMHEICDI